MLLVLKAQGTTDSQSYIQQICRTYPKFTPLLHSPIPQNLIPIIWNDPVMKKLASIIGNKPVKINKFYRFKKQIIIIINI